MRHLLLCTAVMAGALFTAGTPVLAGDDKDKDMKTMTGCLTRGADANQYTLTDNAGTVLALSDHTDLAKHLNHTVKVTVQHRMDDPNKPASTQAKMHTVKKIEHVANTCSGNR